MKVPSYFASHDIALCDVTKAGDVDAEAVYIKCSPTTNSSFCPTNSQEHVHIQITAIEDYEKEARYS